MPTPNAGKPYPQMIADLKGLKIGISTPGASTDVTLRFLLREAGLDPQKDVTIVPVGDPTTALAALKNGLIDGNMSVEPTQTAAVTGLKIAKHVLNIEDGEGPELFSDYAYNGVFARGATLKERPQAARAVVDAIIEAEQRINDPNQLDDIVKVAQAYMRGIDVELLRTYLQTYRENFSPVATPAAIRNISQMLLAGKLIAQPVLVVAGGGAGPHAARASQAVGSLIVAASETDALPLRPVRASAWVPSPTAAGCMFARLAVLVAFLGLWQLVVAVGLVDAFWISSRR